LKEILSSKLNGAFELLLVNDLVEISD
jgi:hypothetical protein